MEGTMSEIRLFAANFAPKTWALCYGQILAISTNQALFSLLGTTYGGNGTTNFALPDFRGRIPAGTGVASGITQFPVGAVLGSNTTTALISNIPAHTHVANGTFSLKVVADVGNTGAPANTNLASLDGLYSNAAADGALKPIMPAITVAPAGNTQPMSIQQPSLGMNYIICIQGIYPSRN
ncbi:phage tail protein [Flavobacterium ginsengiterrae]|uniref:Tail fiber protein n=1 Tax=Flavobacterium ginsengiterrae TaxID=871695 RepID=A0ABP7H660_9FLAO